MIERPILITGSAGLIGSALRPAIEAAGHPVIGFDLRATGVEHGDVRQFQELRAALTGCSGVIHLAAVSRVVWAEKDPSLCWDTNVNGLRNLLAAARSQNPPPWLVFASSREVYGNSANLPINEQAKPSPVNFYARSKLEGEWLVSKAASTGLRAMIVRFSNVYGRTSDHADRVIPAFANAAAKGETIRVDGPRNCFDFTHVDDVVCGLIALVRHFILGQSVLPTIHFVSGTGTTLGELAKLANTLGGEQCRIVEAPPSRLHVWRFIGCGKRARRLLGWQARIPLPVGLAHLIEGFHQELDR